MWVTALALAALTSAGPLASGDDEAASAVCGESPAMQPAQAAPAVIDCNDPGMSVWVAEMIGSCDMPRPPSPAQVRPGAVRPAREPVANRSCDTFRCGAASTPLNITARALDDDLPALLTRATLPDSEGESRVVEERPLSPADLGRARLERPPRA